MLVTRLAQWSMVGWLVGYGVVFTMDQPDSQTQDTMNERNRSTVEALRHEVDELTNARLDVRVSVLEDTVTEVKWLGRTAAGILLGQLLLSLASNRPRGKGTP